MELVQIMRGFMLACGCDDVDRWASVVQMIYDDERINMDSAFHVNEIDKANPDNRLAVAFAWPSKDENKKRHCRNLMLLVLINHYVKTHRNYAYEKLYGEVYAQAEKDEKVYQDVYSIMTVEDTTDYSFWD